MQEIFLVPPQSNQSLHQEDETAKTVVGFIFHYYENCFLFCLNIVYLYYDAKKRLTKQ